MSDQLEATRNTAGAETGTRRAIAMIRVALPRFQSVEGLVEIRFLDDDVGRIYVDGARQDVSEQPSGEIALSITMSSHDFLLVADGLRNPRTLFGFARSFHVEGPIPDAMHFFDKLQGVERRQPAFDPAILPKPTPSLAQAKADFAEFGYCLLRDALSPETVGKLRRRLVEQAAGERAAGVATLDGGVNTPNQRVWHLPNKGQEFIDILDEPVIDAFFPEHLGQNYLICSYSANIVGEGGDSMHLHYDQGQIDPPIGEVMMGLNMAFFLDDVSEENGGTRLMPGSVGDLVGPDNPLVTDGTVAATGPAGTVLIWDSRLWHGTGTNRTSSPRHVLLLYCIRFFLRQQDNYGLLLRDSVRETLSDRVKTMLGFRVTNSLGGVGLKEGAMVERPAAPIGQLEPSSH